MIQYHGLCFKDSALTHAFSLQLLSLPLNPFFDHYYNLYYNTLVIHCHIYYVCCTSYVTRPTYLDLSRARAYSACCRCGWGCLDVFLSSIIPLFLSPSLWETARYRLKCCLKGPLRPNQPTNLICNIVDLRVIKLFLCSVLFSRPSVARTRMACLPWLFSSRSWVPWKKT